MTTQFQRLLRPRSIAVVGGGAWCEAVVAQNRKIGYDGAIWPVHPSRDSIGGLPAFADIGALPGVPDAAFIGVNRNATIETVRALNEAGAGGAVCFASGFRETSDGIELQSNLLQAAGEMTLLGPNCYGFINYVDGVLLWPDQHGGARASGGAAIVTQSSNIAINLTMQTRGLPLTYVVTAGNQAQIGLADIGMALLEDHRVSVLGLHIEGIEDIRAFEALAAMARRLGKSVVVLKVGNTEHARRAALSHTASLAGRAAGAEALFRRLGMGQVRTLAEFIEALKLLHVAGPLPSKQIASMSCSGGEAALIGDTAYRHGLEFPPISDLQETRLRELLGPLVSPSNPLDYHTQIWRDGEALTETFATMMTADIALALLVLDFPRKDRCDRADWDRLIAAALSARERSGGKLAVVSSIPENLPEEIAARFIDGGVVPFNGLEEACAAIRCAADVADAPEQAPILIAPAPSASAMMTEAAAKAELAPFGVHVPVSRSAGTPEEAAHVAEEIGYPVVLKGGGIAHKSERGAVVLGLNNADEVEDAARRMSAGTFLVEQQVAGGVAELLIGVTRDEAHGFLLTVGAGGTMTELLKDTQSLLLPTSPEMIERALDALKIAPLLSGFRGAPAAGLPAIVSAIMAVQDYVVAKAERIVEVEINPLICGPDFAIAADALISKEKADD
ncbi:acetate--CoA ligase family protein [Hoeflea sp.]|uniref:acetate--CoA ligase family protein n=1 Tax=Hoeflea sp. TaxID=1940281 RepID=UPI003B02E3AA